MRRTMIRWSLAGFALSLILGGGLAQAVEPEDEVEVILNSEFMIMNSFGDDLHVLTVKRESDEQGVTQDARHIESDSDFGWRGDLQYKKGNWGAGISGFHFDNDGEESERMRGDSSDDFSFKTPWVGPECDDDEFCVFEADAEMEVWMIDLYGIRKLVETPDVGIDLQFGLRLADFEWQVDGAAALVDASSMNDQLATTSSDEARWWKSDSEPDDILVGPFLSLLANGRYGRFRAEGQFTQAVVFGETEGLNHMFELDSGVSPQFFGSPVFEDNTRVTSGSDVVIPITDLRIKLGYDIIDNLTLGFGAYATTWFDVPRPPKSSPDEFNFPNVVDVEEQILTFLGASFSLEYRFHGARLPSLSSLMP